MQIQQDVWFTLFIALTIFFNVDGSNPWLFRLDVPASRRSNNADVARCITKTNTFSGICADNSESKNIDINAAIATDSRGIDKPSELDAVPHLKPNSSTL